MQIKYVTQQTWKMVYEPENKEPSLTRESDYESIESLFARFKAAGLVYETVFKPIAQLSEEERDILENSTDIGDLIDEDLTVQQAFIDQVNESMKRKSVESEDKKEPTQPKVEPEKPATEPEDA